MMIARRLLLSLLLLGSPLPASAQDDAATPPAPVAGAGAEAGALPEYVWTTEAVSLARWPGVEGVSAEVPAGRRVVVVFQDGEQVRVRSGTDFGWLSRAQLSVTDPSAPAPTEEEILPELEGSVEEAGAAEPAPSPSPAGE